jgi:hypothetical protein
VYKRNERVYQLENKTSIKCIDLPYTDSVKYGRLCMYTYKSVACQSSVRTGENRPRLEKSAVPGVVPPPWRVPDCFCKSGAKSQAKNREKSLDLEFSQRRRWLVGESVAARAPGCARTLPRGSVSGSAATPPLADPKQCSAWDRDRRISLVRWPAVSFYSTLFACVFFSLIAFFYSLL